MISGTFLLFKFKRQFLPWSDTMEQFPLLDIVIGLSLIYTLLSLLSSELTEFVVTVLRWRTRSLKRGIMILLGESLDLDENSNQFKDTITGRLYSSASMPAIIQYFNQRRIPVAASFIPGELFAEVLLEVLQGLPNADNLAGEETASEMTLEKLLSMIESSSKVSPQLRANLNRLIRRTQIVQPEPKQQMAQLKHEIALWFNYSMADAIVVYKHDLKVITFLVSFVLAIVINADSLYIIRRISENTATRAIVVQNATQVQGCQDDLNSPQCVERMSSVMESSTLPIGWHPINRQRQFSQFNIGNLSRATGGWLLTGIAISMGSRFWFQLLNRLLHFRDSNSKSVSSARYRKYKSSYDSR
jgi:hypothetical protein